MILKLGARCYLAQVGWFRARGPRQAYRKLGTFLSLEP